MPKKTCDEWWGRHVWNNWTVKERGVIQRGGTKDIGNYLVQERSCVHCGFVELHKQKVIVV